MASGSKSITPGPRMRDPVVAAQHLDRHLRQVAVLAGVPDAPLAAVDRLADDEGPPVRHETLGELLDRRAPARRVAHQVAVLRQAEGEVALAAAAGRQLAGQRLLGGVVLLPGMEAQQEVAHAEVGHRGEQRRGVVRPRAQRDAGAGERHRPHAALGRQLAVAPPHPRQGGEGDARLGGVRAGVAEAGEQLLELAGVQVRLVGQRVPHHALAGGGAARRARDVGVGAARQHQVLGGLGDAVETAADGVLRLVLEAEAAVVEAVEGALDGAGGAVPSVPRGVTPRPRCRPVGVEEEALVGGAVDHHPRQVAAALARPSADGRSAYG